MATSVRLCGHCEPIYAAKLLWTDAMHWLEERIAKLRQRCAGLFDRRATLEAERARAREINTAASVTEQIKRLDAEINDLCRDIADAERKWAAH
jgi:hypothetical protein